MTHILHQCKENLISDDNSVYSGSQIEDLNKYQWSILLVYNFHVKAGEQFLILAGLKFPNFQSLRKA